MQISQYHLQISFHDFALINNEYILKLSDLLWSYV